MADHLNTKQGGARIDTTQRRPIAIGSSTPSRRRSDLRWADTTLEHPACGAEPVWAGIDHAEGGDRTVIATYEGDRLVRLEEWREQSQGDGMGTFIVTALGLVGVLGLLALCWWLGHDGKWAPLW